MKTIIYSCGKSMTSNELVSLVPDVLAIDYWFPELGDTRVNGDRIPLTEHEILFKLPKLVGKTIVTVNEIVILMMLREIRKGHMRTDELELWCGDMQIDIGVTGDMLDPWDGGFFELGFNLRFH